MMLVFVFSKSLVNIQNMVVDDTLSFLDVANGKLLRLFAFEILKVQFDVAHVFVNISRWYYLLGALYKLSLIIYAIEQDGDLCFLSDEIKSLFPIWVKRTGPFGGYAKHKVFSLDSLGSKIVGHACVLATPYWDTAHFPENRSQRPKEPFFLHKEIALESFCMGKKLTEQ